MYGIMDKKSTFKIVLLFILFQSHFAIADEATQLYEPVNGVCNKCNCSSADGTIEDATHGRVFTLNCAMKDFQRLFTGWPEEAGDNSTDLELIFMMSHNPLRHLQQIQSTDAKLFFTCRHCKINSIASHAFIDSPNIVLLDLSYNDITTSELFPEIFRGPERDDEYAPISLEILDLSHNKINSLEKLLFEHVPNLKSLSLSFNDFENFDEPTEQAIGSLRKLEILDLSFTGIAKISSAMLEHSAHLRELFLTGNKLTSVPESLISVGKTLEILYLDGNSIEFINEESFVGLEKLEKLNISNLQGLNEIKENSLKHLTFLQVFDCHGNKNLRDFNMEDLRELKVLKEIDISNNALKHLNFGRIDLNKDAESLDGKNEKKYDDQFKKLRRLKLGGNPWHCDCDTMASLSLFNHSAKYYIRNFDNDEARCATPSSLSSKLLYHLPKDYVCDTHAKQKDQKIPIYDPPPFLRPKSIMLTVFSVVGVIVLGIIIGFVIVCIKNRLKSDDSYPDSPIRYTTVRDSTVSNVANSPYSQ